MLKKLFVLVLTSGLAVKLYKSYSRKHDIDSPADTNQDAASPKRPARKQA